MSLTLSQLATEHQASLLDSAHAFAPEDFARHLQLAALDMGRVFPRTKRATLQLAANQSNYPVPADFLGYKFTTWGDDARANLKPWDGGFPKHPPKAYNTQDDDGNVQLTITPKPTAYDIKQLGANFCFLYYAGHKLSDNPAETTLRPEDKGLLLLRTQAEAMRELAFRNINKPTSLRDGQTQGPRNGTPSALWQALMNEFERKAQW